MICDEDEDEFFCEWCHANPCICDDEDEDGGWAINSPPRDSLWDVTDEEDNSDAI